MFPNILDEIDPVIEQIDFDPVIFQLIRKEGWSLDRAERTVAEYRTFLHLIKHSGVAMVPATTDVDVCWHHHILDTRKYCDDCDQIVGRYIHHFPYSGSLGEHDAHLQKQRFDVSQQTLATFQQKGIQ